MNPYIFMALSLGILAGVLVQSKGEDLDPSERIYAYILIAAMMLLLIYVPFYIPTTGEIVHGFAWETIEYPDELMQNVLTPVAVKTVEIELKKHPDLGVNPNWVQDSIMQRASPSRGRMGLYLGLLAILGGAGWWFVPPLINRLIFRLDSREYHR